MSESLAQFSVDPDGWVHLTPFGEFPHRTGVVQVIDRRAADAIKKSFDAKKEAEGDLFAGVLLDYDHFSMDTDKPSEAAGWIVGMEVRDDGLWGKVRWTDTGLKAVTGGRYRFVSLVFPPAAEFEEVEAGTGRKRPLSVVSCALTNEPNIKGGRPIANRQVGSALVRDCGSALVESREGDGNLTPNVERPTRNAEGGEGKREGTLNAQRGEGIPGVAVGGEDAKRYMWLLGETKSGKHCPLCLGRHGQVKTLLGWMRMPAPYCKCRCHLAEVGKDVAEGYEPPVPGVDGAEVANRVERFRGLVASAVANRWSDAARIASASARLAKYGAMMGLRPWGVTARAAAASSRRSAGGGKRTTAKKSGACFVCGGSGHWAKDCPRRGGRPAAAKRTASKPSGAAAEFPTSEGKALAARMAKLPPRAGGYRTDGTPAVRDLVSEMSDAGTSAMIGKTVIRDAEPIERRERVYRAELAELFDRSRRTAERIEAFHGLVAAMGGALGGAAGARNPAGAASSAFGASVSGTRPPGALLYRKLKALDRLMRLHERQRAAGVGEGGFTASERGAVRDYAKQYARSMWFSDLRGTGIDSKLPDSTEHLMGGLPVVTGNPLAKQRVMEAAKATVRETLSAARQKAASEKAMRETYLKDLREAGVDTGDVTNILTPFLREWRDRVTGRGAYGPTGTYRMGKVGEASTTYGRHGYDAQEEARATATRGRMESAVREWVPEADVFPGIPHRILVKLYRRALARRDARFEETFREPEYPETEESFFGGAGGGL